MEVVFRKAPLVELLAELRWQPPQITIPVPQPQPGQAPSFLLATNTLEDFFQRFGAEVQKRGFQSIERLIPPGFLVPQGAVVCRFKSNSPDKATLMYQAGAGVFSANATPPYRSWATFAPQVKTGVEILLQTRDENEKAAPFKPVSLRYIDAFRPELIAERDALAFFEQILGVHVKLPNAILKYLAPNKTYNPFLGVAIPVSTGTLRVSTGEAIISGSTAMLLDMIYSHDAPVEADAGAVMSTLDAAHAMIHDIFMDLTEPIRHLMEPEH